MGFIDKVKAIFQTGKVINRARTDSKKAEDYSVDAQICIDYYKSDPIIKRAITTIVNKMFSDGYRFNSIDDTDQTNQVNQAEEFFKRTGYYGKLKDATRVTLITGDGYQEIADDVFNLNTPEISIKEKDGEIEEYVQKINGRIVAKIDPDNVIHLTTEKLGDTFYGVGLVESILFVSAIKRFAEGNIAKRFKNEKLRGFWLFKGMSDQEYDAMCDIITEAKDDPQRDIYLKGGDLAQIEYSDLVKGQDMEFATLLSYARQQQISGLMLHPINVGLPEGSNKSTSQEENRDFDEAIASYQEAIEQIVTKRLLHEILGLDKIELELISVNKRDTERELDIATKLNQLPTSINEVREEIGYPLIEEDWANEIRNVTSLDLEMEGEDEEDDWEDREDEEEKRKEPFQKALKKKQEKFPKESPIRQADERQFYNILKNWLVTKHKELIKEITNNKDFKKEISDPNIYVDRILNKKTPDTLKKDVEKQLNRVFEKGKLSVETQIGRNIIANKDALKFLTNYTFDLIKDLDESLKGKLKQTLRRGIIEGQSLLQIKQRIKADFKITNSRASTIARTETNRVANSGRFEAYKSAGVKRLRWVSVVDNNTSEICKTLNGEEIEIDKTFKALDFEGISPPAHPNCFVKGTKITTNKGKKNIENIKPDDMVLTHKNRFRKVTTTMSRQADEIYTIQAGKKTINVTGEHPVMTNKGWKLVKDLKLNDYIMSL